MIATPKTTPDAGPTDPEAGSRWENEGGKAWASTAASEVAVADTLESAVSTFEHTSAARVAPDNLHNDLREMLRDAEVAYAIRPVVDAHHLTFSDTAAALTTLNVPRAQGVAMLATSVPLFPTVKT